MSFSAGADARRWILTPPPPTADCRRCADGAAVAESRRQRDRLLCPHCSSTSPTTAPPPPPVELGEAVSEESEVWWCACSRAGLRPAVAEERGAGCGARARSGLDSCGEAARYEARREPSVATARASSSLMKEDLDACFRGTAPPPPPPPLPRGRQSGLSLWYLQRIKRRVDSLAISSNKEIRCKMQVADRSLRG